MLDRGLQIQFIMKQGCWVQHPNSRWPSFQQVPRPPERLPTACGHLLPATSCNLRAAASRAQAEGRPAARQAAAGGGQEGTTPPRGLEGSHSRHSRGRTHPRGHGDTLTSCKHHPSTKPTQSSNRARDTVTQEDRLGQEGSGSSCVLSRSVRARFCVTCDCGPPGLCLAGFSR